MEGKGNEVSSLQHPLLLRAPIPSRRRRWQHHTAEAAGDAEEDRDMEGTEQVLRQAGTDAEHLLEASVTPPDEEIPLLSP